MISTKLSIIILLTSICICTIQTIGYAAARPTMSNSQLEYSFDIWDWTAPAKDLVLFDKWAGDLKSIGVTRMEISAPWNQLEPEPEKIDLSYIRDRLDICKKHGLGLRVRINSYYAGCTPAWYDGNLWQDSSGGVPMAIPSIADERFWAHYEPLCTAIAREFRGDDILYSAFIGVHAELKYSDWWSYDPAHLKLWREAILRPRPEWLARVVGDDVELPEIPPVPGITHGKPDTSPQNLAVIAFREHCWRKAIERFTNALRKGDQHVKISSPLGESYRRGSAQMSNLDYRGLTRGSNQVIHSYDFFWHPGSTASWHHQAVLDSFRGITGLPVNLEFDSLQTIRQMGYTDRITCRMIQSILESGSGIKVANMSYVQELRSKFLPLRFAGEQLASGKYKLSAPVEPKNMVLLFFSKWANYCYREETDWLHDAQFGFWKLLRDMDIPVRVICEDNLGEDLSKYRGIILAFSPLDLMPSADRDAILRLRIPIIADVSGTPTIRPEERISLKGEPGELVIETGMPCDSIQDLSKLPIEGRPGMQGVDLPFMMYDRKSFVMGFPLGWHYLHGADQMHCRELMKYAMRKAGVRGIK